MEGCSVLVGPHWVTGGSSGRGDNCSGEGVIKTSYVNLSCWRATTLELWKITRRHLSFIVSVKQGVGVW